MVRADIQLVHPVCNVTFLYASWPTALSPWALLPVQYPGLSPGITQASHMPVTPRCSLVLWAPGPCCWMGRCPFQWGGTHAVPVAQYLISSWFLGWRLFFFLLRALLEFGALLCPSNSQAFSQLHAVLWVQAAWGWPGWALKVSFDWAPTTCQMPI